MDDPDVMSDAAHGDDQGRRWPEPDNSSGDRTGIVGLPELRAYQKLDFSPTVNVTPDGKTGSCPTGLTVGIHVLTGNQGKPGGFRLRRSEGARRRVYRRCSVLNPCHERMVDGFVFALSDRVCST